MSDDIAFKRRFHVFLMMPQNDVAELHVVQVSLRLRHLARVLRCQSEVNAPQTPQSTCFVLTNIAIYGKLIMPIAGFHSNFYSESQTGFIRQFVLTPLLHVWSCSLLG